MSQLSFLICTESDGARVRQQLDESGHAHVEAAVLPEALARELETRAVDALFVELGSDPDTFFEALEQIPRPLPLLIMSGPPDSELLLRAMRLGAKEFFPLDAEASHVSASLQRLIVEAGRPESEQPGRKGDVLAVLGAKGGIGATSVACQLAGALQRVAPTAILDLNMLSGDVALHFDLVPRYTVADLRGEAEVLDATILRTLLEGHSSGVQVLAASDQIEDGEALEPANLQRTVQILAREFSWLVLDLPRSWNGATLRALDLADQILLVTGFDLPALSRTRKLMELLRRLGRADRVRLVCNRQGSGAVGAREFTRFLERAPDLCMPSDFQTASAAIEQGKLVSEIAPGGVLEKAYRALVAQVYDWSDVPLPVAARQPLLRRWSRRAREHWPRFLKRKRHVPA